MIAGTVDDGLVGDLDRGVQRGWWKSGEFIITEKRMRRRVKMLD